MAGNDNRNKKRTRRYVPLLGRYIKSRFNLDRDQAPQHEVIELIARSVEFKGTNLWVLIFATAIACIGLNINSSPMVIGAMLISPLMGPIMGVGLSLGINDFDLMKRSLRNTLLMTIITILTSIVYFWISPISTAQSELLARTTPTVYDLLVAFFGGMAGMVAQTRKDRTISTVIPGVAIATTLLPPLCTAGYGIATFQIRFLLGGFYLFFINCVFIAFATVLMVWFFRYDKKAFVDRAQARRVSRSMIAIVVISAIPSIIMGYRIVQQTIFNSNVDRYVAMVFNFADTQLIDYTKTIGGKNQPSRISVLLLGEPLPEDVIEGARMQLSSYGLAGTELIVRQPGDGGERLDFSTININYATLIDEKNRQISHLQDRLSRYDYDTLAVAGIAREAGVVVDNVEAVSLSRAISYSVAGQPEDTVLIVTVRPVNPRAAVNTRKLEEWLRLRTNIPQVSIYVKDKK